MSEESWGRSVERERDVGRSIVGRWSAERDLLWYSCLSMAPWFLQRLLRDKQVLSGTPAGQGQYACKVANMQGVEIRSSEVHIFKDYTSKFYPGYFMRLQLKSTESSNHKENGVCFSYGQISPHLHCNGWVQIYKSTCSWQYIHYHELNRQQ